MHQSFETLGGWPGGIHLVCEWKQVNSCQSEWHELLRPHMSHTHDTPFFKKTEELKIMFYSLLEFL